jgi:uncharacterized repeat protein (TIGR03803 family)
MTPTRNVFTPFLCLAISIIVLAGSALAGTDEQVIYRFKGGSDGFGPAGALLADKVGNLYGTTAEGGINGGASCAGVHGCGTVFELSPPAQSSESWTKTVLYRFKGGSDGYGPGEALVADKDGNLYSTTAVGGTGNCVNGGETGCGTIFELVRPTSAGGAWTHLVLHSFTGVPSGKGDGDGALPSGVVFDGAGNLYGTTDGGGYCYTPMDSGALCFGAVFELAAPSSAGGAWTESVIWRFGESGLNSPHGDVIFDKTGRLYGTTYIGGAFGVGGVFKVTPAGGPGSAWTETALYFFDGSDGGAPNDSLVFDGAGNLYGTTLIGGAANEGAVFQLTPPESGGDSWTETVLYSFRASDDGNSPLGNVIFDRAGNLFSTTWQGGTYGDQGGTVFELTPAASQGAEWTETVLHVFGAGDDGVQPRAGLIFGLDGALYGTASTGGSTKVSASCPEDNFAGTCGVVFRVEP